MKKHVSPNRRAFTLVEILVVLGILVLLSAILFPVFGRVRETGRRTVCTSNLKQLGLAFQQYVGDSGNRYPYAGNYQVWAGLPEGSPTAWTGATAHWVTGGEGGTPMNYPSNSASGLANSSVPTLPATGFDYYAGREAYVEKGALFPYVKSASLYVCPSVPDGDKKKLTYSMNCAIAGISNVRIRNPSQIVLLVDEGKSLNDGYFWAAHKDHPDNAASTDTLFNGHSGGGNLLFADGHVKFFTFESFPLDWNGPASTPGTGLGNKNISTGEVRFHDAAFGAKNSNRAPSGTQTTCGDVLP